MPAQWDLPVDLVDHRRRVLGFLHRGQHITRANGDHAHGGRELEGHRPRQLDHTGLRGVVVGIHRMADQPVRRGHVDDHATSRLDHAAGGLLGHVEDAIEVDRENR